METHRMRILRSIPRVSSSGAQLVFSFPVQFSFTINCSSGSYNSGIPVRDRQKLHKHFLHVAILSGPLVVEGHVDAIVTLEPGFEQVVITTCNPIEKLTPNTIVAAAPGLVLIIWQCAAITVPVNIDHTVHSTSLSAATADLQNTMRDSKSSLSRG